jgi:hypothetical protein
MSYLKVVCFNGKNLFFNKISVTFLGGIPCAGGVWTSLHFAKCQLEKCNKNREAKEREKTKEPWKKYVWTMPILVFFLSRVYLSILSFETFNKLKLSYECGIPRPQDAGIPLLLLVRIFNLYIILIAVLENVPPTQGYRKETPLP